jgi:hypothetical protein
VLTITFIKSALTMPPSTMPLNFVTVSSQQYCVCHSVRISNVRSSNGRSTIAQRFDCCCLCCRWRRLLWGFVRICQIYGFPVVATASFCRIFSPACSTEPSVTMPTSKWWPEVDVYGESRLRRCCRFSRFRAIVFMSRDLKYVNDNAACWTAPQACC